MAVIDPFFGSLIAAGLALVGVWLQTRKTRRMNSDEHNRGQEATQTALKLLAQGQVHIIEKVDEVKSVVEDHIADGHTHQGV